MTDVVRAGDLPSFHDADDETKALIKERAVKMRMVKVPITQVARECGVSVATVHKWVGQAVRERHGSQTDEDFRAMDALSLEALENNAYTMLRALLQCDPVDVDLVIKTQAHISKILEQRAKLLGYVAPIRVIHNRPVRDEFDHEIEELVAYHFGGQLISQPTEVYTRDGDTSD